MNGKAMEICVFSNISKIEIMVDQRALGKCNLNFIDSIRVTSNKPLNTSQIRTKKNVNPLIRYHRNAIEKFT